MVTCVQTDNRLKNWFKLSPKLSSIQYPKQSPKLSPKYQREKAVYLLYWVDMGTCVQTSHRLKNWFKLSPKLSPKQSPKQSSEYWRDTKVYLLLGTVMVLYTSNKTPTKKLINHIFWPRIFSQKQSSVHFSSAHLALTVCHVKISISPK